MFVRPRNAPKFPIRVPAADTIASIKAKISAKTGMPLYHVTQPTLKNKRLKDDHTLSDYSIEDSWTVSWYGTVKSPVTALRLLALNRNQDHNLPHRCPLTVKLLWPSEEARARVV